MKINFKKLIVCILIPLGVGALSALLSGGGMADFGSVTKPPLSSPGWLFPIVWTILYSLMGIASYIIYDAKRGEKQKEALTFYGLQLAVNFIWPIIFFRFEAYWVAVIVILILLALVLITAVKFKEINNVSFWLLVPYIAWLIFATYLNIGVAVLN